MYFQRDYVLRMIEMMGEFARRLLDMAREEDARIELDQVSRRACGMPLAMLKRRMCKRCKRCFPNRSAILAHSCCCSAAKLTRARALRRSLPPRARRRSRCFPRWKIRTMYPTPARWPAGRWNRCLIFFRRRSCFAPQRCLSAAMIMQPPKMRSMSQATGKRAKPFYERLLRLDDAALLAGNLPREEILEAAAKL